MYTETDTATLAQPVNWQALRAAAPAPQLQPPTQQVHPAALGLPLQLLDVVDIGVLLVDVAARLLYANPAARLACQEGAPLALCQGQLHGNPQTQQRVDTALLAAQRGQWSMLSLRRGSRTQAVAVVPLGSNSGIGGGATAALLLGSDGRPSRLALQFFSQNSGLTPAEAAVLDALCAGLKPAQIALAGGVAVCTVRSQISAVRAKTGARSVSDLLRTVGGLPPIARHTTQALA